MSKQYSYVIAQSTRSDLIVDDITTGATAWTTWSIGLLTAALGLMLLALLGRFMFNRL